jgi:hypothetical protein
VVAAQFIASMEVVAEIIQKQKVPSVTVIFDESRVWKRQVMAVILALGDYVVAMATQEVSDSHNLRTDPGDAEKMFAEQLAAGAEEKPRRNPKHKDKGATASAYASLLHSIKRTLCMDLRLTLSPQPLLPCGKHETRQLSQDVPGAHIVVNKETGLSLDTCAHRAAVSMPCSTR